MSMTNDKSNEKKVIENMTFIKQNMSELYPSAKAESEQEISNLLSLFESHENKNIEKLEYLIKQVATFINKFENLENETILEQFEKILYSINNSRLELLEEIAKLSSGKINLNDIKVNNVTPQNIQNLSEEATNAFLSELLIFKKSNNATLSKVYFNLKKQLDDLKSSLVQNSSDKPEGMLGDITNNITGLKNETNLIKQIISTQNEQLNQVLYEFNEKFLEDSNTDNETIKENLNALLLELSAFKKSNNTNLKNIYLNLNKKIDGIKTAPEINNISETNITENLIKNLTTEIAQLRNETANNSRKIQVLLDTINLLNANIQKIGILVDKNFSTEKKSNLL